MENSLQDFQDWQSLAKGLMSKTKGNYISISIKVILLAKATEESDKVELLKIDYQVKFNDTAKKMIIKIKTTEMGFEVFAIIPGLTSGQDEKIGLVPIDETQPTKKIIETIFNALKEEKGCFIEKSLSESY